MSLCWHLWIWCNTPFFMELFFLRRVYSFNGRKTISWFIDLVLILDESSVASDLFFVLINVSHVCGSRLDYWNSWNRSVTVRWMWVSSCMDLQSTDRSISVTLGIVIARALFLVLRETKGAVFLYHWQVWLMLVSVAPASFVPGLGVVNWTLLQFAGWP